MNKVVVSIVIPVYNVEKYLFSCIKSIQGQTLNTLEIIAVNDASTDGSLNILQKIAEQDNRIKIIDLVENHGVSYARNCGMMAARGEYLYFLDADDWIDQEALLFLTSMAENDNLDAVLFDKVERFSTEEIRQHIKEDSGIYQGRLHVYPDVLSGTEMYLLLAKSHDYCSSPGCILWRRECLVKSNIMFNEKLSEAEDDLFYFQGMLVAKRVRVVNQAYYKYYRRENSLSTATCESRMVRTFRAYFFVYLERNQSLLEAKDISLDTKLSLYQSEQVLYDSLLSRYGALTKYQQNQMDFTELEQVLLYNKIEKDYQIKYQYWQLLKLLVAGQLVHLIGDENFRTQVCRLTNCNFDNYERIYDENKHIDGNKLLRDIHQSKKVYVFFTTAYDIIRPLIETEGFIENENFSNGMTMLV